MTIAFRTFGHTFFRHFSSTSSSKHILEHLSNRSLIKLQGNDVSEFLQGLITNDIHHLDRGPGSMFTMFLNVKGRVLFDTIFYRNEEENTFLIECDSDGSNTLQKHLKMYKVRRKIDIKLVDDYKVSVLFNSKDIRTVDVKNEIENDNLERIVPCNEIQNTSPDISVKIFKDLYIFKDPRVSSLGSRIISKKNTNVKEQVKEIINIDNDPQQIENYKVLRYSLGIAEGTNDLPVGNCLPLESNCDYLHGVSFHKGCYIGQELTARTYHTGVIRRRLMPLLFTKVPTKLPDDNVIKCDNVKLGKLRGIVQNVGLAQLKISEALKLEKIPVGDGVAKVFKPDWWPIEMTKEKVGLQKT